MDELDERGGLDVRMARATARAAREHDSANVAAGKQRTRLASFLQFTLPGAPTVYYGDEAQLQQALATTA